MRKKPKPTVSFDAIKEALVAQFGGVVKKERLSQSGGSKTVQNAKRMGVFFAKQAGYKGPEIAPQFGYASEKTVFTALKKINNDLQRDLSVIGPVQRVAETLGLDLENE